MKEKIFHFFQIFSPLILGSLVGFVIKDFMDYSSLNQPPFARLVLFFPLLGLLFIYLWALVIISFEKLIKTLH